MTCAYTCSGDSGGEFIANRARWDGAAHSVEESLERSSRWDDTCSLPKRAHVHTQVAIDEVPCFGEANTRVVDRLLGEGPLAVRLIVSEPANSSSIGSFVTSR